MGDRVTEWGTELLIEFIISGFSLQTMKREDLRWSTNKEKSHRIIQVIQDKTRQDKTRQDKARQDNARQDKTMQDKTRQHKTRQDTAT